MIFLRILFYIVIFIITLIYFLPKNDLVSYVNSKVLAQYKINTKIKLENDMLNYVSSNSSISYQKNLVANVGTLNVSPYILFNEIKLTNINLKGMAGSLFPSKITHARLLYSVIDPTKINITIEGDFGKAIGYFDILSSLVHLEVTPSRTLQKNYSFLLKYMKKSKKSYIYEYKL